VIGSRRRQTGLLTSDIGLRTSDVPPDTWHLKPNT